jgi:hypothetical protein
LRFGGGVWYDSRDELGNIFRAGEKFLFLRGILIKTYSTWRHLG